MGVQVIKRTYKAIFTVASFTIATRILSFIFKIYLSRTVGAEVIGLYQIALSIFALLTCITATGIPLTLSRKTAEYNAQGLKNKIPNILGTSILIGFIMSMIVVTLIYSCKQSLDFLFKDERAIPIFLIMLPSLISTTIYSILRGWFWGMKDFKSFSFGEFSEEIFRIIFTVLLAGGIITTLKREIGLAIAFTISDVLCAVVLFVIFVKKGGRVKKPKEAYEMMKFATPITLMRIFAGIIMSLTAIVIPAQLAKNGMAISDATAAFGRVIGLAFPLLFIPLAITGSLGIVLIPEVSSHNAIGQMDKISKQIHNTLVISITIVGLFLAEYLAFGREIGLIIFNDSIAGRFVRYGAPMMLFIVISQLTSSLLNSIAKEGRSFMNYTVGAVVLVVLIYVLPKYISIYAVIVAHFAFFIILSILNTISLKKYKVIDYKFLKVLVVIVIFAIPSAYFSRTVFELIADKMPLFFSTTIASLVNVIFYGVLILVSDIFDLDIFYVKLKKLKKKYIN